MRVHWTFVGVVAVALMPQDQSLDRAANITDHESTCIQLATEQRYLGSDTKLVWVQQRDRKHIADSPPDYDLVVWNSASNELFAYYCNVRTRQLSNGVRDDAALPRRFRDDARAAHAIALTSPQWLSALERRGLRPDDVILSLYHLSQPSVDNAPMHRTAAAKPFLMRSKADLPCPIDGLVGEIDFAMAKLTLILDQPAYSSCETATDFVGFWNRVREPENAPSLRVKGDEVSWSGWTFHVGFTAREGVVLRDVSFRSAGVSHRFLNRGSFAEVAVAYGSADESWQLVNVFDESDFGLGLTAKTLIDGEDVPVGATLLDVAVYDENARRRLIAKAIAVYERDAGILLRLGSQTIRDRQLVVSSTAHLGNYLYDFNWIFRADGTLEIEAVATGILVVAPKSVDPGSHPVAKSLRALTHTHVFVLRLDVDVSSNGRNDAVYELESRRIGGSDSQAVAMHPAQLFTELDARRHVNPDTSRLWRITRSDAEHLTEGVLVIPGRNSSLLAGEDSNFSRQLAAARYHFWATEYRADELYAGGDSPGLGRQTGLPDWTRRNASLADTDIVVWYSMLFVHTPRREEWPAISSQRLSVQLAPDGFFASNPALQPSP